MQTLFKSIWLVVGVIGTIGGLFAYTIFLPKISLNPVGVLNPSDPFKTPFILKNEGSFSIKNISTETVLISVVDSRDNQFNNNFLKGSLNDSLELKNGRQTGVNISLEPFIIGLGLPFQQASMGITIRYTWLLFWKREEVFKFKLEKIDADKSVWIPTNF